MKIEHYEKIKEHFQLICFAAASPVFMLIATHIFSCKFSFLMNTLSIVKITWGILSFLGRENLGIINTMKRLVISALLFSMCYFEMTNRQFFIINPHFIGIDFFFTFVLIIRYYFQWIYYYLQVGGILENTYLIQTTITAVTVWKTY